MLGLINRKSTINNNTYKTTSPILFPHKISPFLDNTYKSRRWLQEKIKKKKKNIFKSR